MYFQVNPVLKNNQNASDSNYTLLLSTNYLADI